MSIQFFVSPSDILLGLSGPGKVGHCLPHAHTHTHTFLTLWSTDKVLLISERESVGQVTLVTVGPSESTHNLQITSLIPQPPQLDSQGYR